LNRRDQAPASEELETRTLVLRQPRLSDRVAEGIVGTIVDQRLEPGDPLPPERDLAGQFGVSRTVIREAVRSLSARGLLDVRMGSRIRVAAVDPAVVHEAIRQYARSHGLLDAEARELSDALGLAAAELAARHANADDIQRLGEAAGRKFRSALMAATHNELLRVLDAAVGQEPGPGLPSQALLAAIGRRDAEAARAAMRELLGHADSRPGGAGYRAP
jgi:GntR family transcriptional repressor for pyruvate dehydrogenase complex